jgi:hypothetical protein
LGKVVDGTAEGFLAPLDDYERLRKKSRNWKVFTAVTAIAAFLAGTLTGLLID